MKRRSGDQRSTISRVQASPPETRVCRAGKGRTGRTESAEGGMTVQVIR